MFPRAYKIAVSLPPITWVLLFLLLPYSVLFLYSFWTVTPSQQIVHQWNTSNYRELLQVPVYLEVSHCLQREIDRHCRSECIA